MSKPIFSVVAVLAVVAFVFGGAAFVSAQHAVECVVVAVVSVVAMVALVAVMVVSNKRRNARWAAEDASHQAYLAIEARYTAQREAAYASRRSGDGKCHVYANGRRIK